MIKLKDLLNEKVTDVKWVDKAYRFASDGKFPFTPTIANILHKGLRITAFHITSIDKLDQLDSIQRSKKSISTMQKVPYKSLQGEILGIWNSGVMFYLEGNLIIRGDTDIMSEPDEQGRRWIQFPLDEVDEEWGSVYSNDSELQRMEKELGSYTRARAEFIPKKQRDILRDYVYRYIELAEKFAKKNKKRIIKSFRNNYSGSDWDEILLNQIQLIDVIWTGYDSDLDLVTDPKKIEKIKTKLKSMVIGKVLTPTKNKESEVRKFVNSRGGKSNYF